MATACALCACDPVEEDKSFDPIEVSSQEISDAFSFVQKDKDGNAAEDGNYFTYNTSPSQIVKVFNYKADGSENVLALGSSGSFTIAPSRGSDPQQKFYVCLYNSEGEKIVAEKTATVFVKQDLTAVEKLFCSNSGRKTYKWNTNAPGGCIWGNMAYQGTDGSAVYTENSTKWWGVVSDTEFADQLKHSVSGALTGEESFNAYFTLAQNGDLNKYDGEGKLLNTTTWSFNTDKKTVHEDGSVWAVGHLETGENSVLWPFEMNGGGKYVTDYEVVYVDDDHLTLVYPDGGNFSSFGGWDEAAYWQFKTKK